MDTTDFGFSNMGVEGSGSSSLDFSTTDLERMVASLLTDHTPTWSYDVFLSQPQNFTRSFIDDKASYFRKISSSIMQAKDNFLRLYTDVNKNIEEVTLQIIRCVKARERKLKAELQEIRAEKVLKWDHQLAVCQEALKRLRRTQISPFAGRECVTYYEDLTKEVEYIEESDLTLDLKSYSDILKRIQTAGRLTYHHPSEDTLSSMRCITPKFVFGSAGDQPGQFCRSWGVCSDATGRILVCDRSNHRIQIFNERGEFLIQFGREGSKHGEFNRPTGIDVNEKCRIIVADKDNHRIQVFSYSGSFLFTFGSQGSAAGQFMYPWDVATNKNCDIAVSDSKNNRVQLFNENGGLLAIFDARSQGIRNPRTALRFLDSPRGLAFAPDGSLLVTDFNNHKVLVLDNTFRKVTAFGCEGTKPGQFFRPQGIACDSLGRFAVADSKNYRVQVFSVDRTLLKYFGTRGEEPGEFNCPQGITFHRNQNILVVDLENNRVQVF